MYWLTYVVQRVGAAKAGRPRLSFSESGGLAVRLTTAQGSSIGATKGAVHLSGSRLAKVAVGVKRGGKGRGRERVGGAED